MRTFISFFFVMLILTGCATTEKRLDTDEAVFYPPLPQTPRLQFLTHINSEEDIGRKQSAFEEFLMGDMPPLKLINRPYAIGTAKDTIYVIDRAYKELIVIDLKSKSFDHVKSRAGALRDPAGIWVSEDDYKYVADFKRQQIVVFDDNNKYVKVYGGKGVLDKPLDVAVYGDDVYVCDVNLNKIIVFDKSSGEVLRSFGEKGSAEGQLFKPTHITVDNKGNLFVNDALNFRIQQFDAFGDFIRVIGYHGDTVGSFSRPKGIAVSDEGHLYVVDVAFENAQIFDANTGAILLFFGKYGPDPGDMYMPTAIHVSRNNLEYFQSYADKNFRINYLVYVGNQFGPRKISIYGFGDWTGDALPSPE